MNKLASIQYVDSLGLPTIWPKIITSRDEKKVRKTINSFYYDFTPGWVLRCAELPDFNAKPEDRLPWDTADSKEELINKTIEMQKQIGSRYYVFCHEVAPMIRGGTLLVEGDYAVVEAAEGCPRELSALFRGKRNPQQSILFKPGMLSFKDSGKQVLTLEDLFELRKAERSILWQGINAIASPVAIEFSRLESGLFYVHDITVVN